MSIYEFLYSQTIVSFIQRMKFLAKKVLLEEMKISSHGNRFFYRGFSYPLSFVVFEGLSCMGYFNHDTYEIAVNKRFILEREEELENLIRHELAHYMFFIRYGLWSGAHGKKYRDLCRAYGWGKDVYLSRVKMSMESDFNAKGNGGRVLEKVKKLLALGAACNSHESEQAMLKANALLLKYHLGKLESFAFPKDDLFDEEMSMKRIFKQRRFTAKLHSIASVLQTFFVYPVKNRGKEYVYLEVFGKRANVSIAEYVGFFLDREFERLWLKVKKENPTLKGATSKNSFFRGLSKGYCDQINALRKGDFQKDKNALICIEKKLESSSKMAYPRLGRHTLRYRNCEASLAFGCKEGAKLQVSEALEKKKCSGKFIPLLSRFHL